jgi:hypothetical protein
MIFTCVKIAVGVLAILTSIGVGIIIGYFSRTVIDNNQNVVDYYNTLIKDYDRNGLYDVIKIVNPNNIKENLRFILFFELNLLFKLMLYLLFNQIYD